MKTHEMVETTIRSTTNAQTFDQIPKFIYCSLLTSYPGEGISGTIDSLFDQSDDSHPTGTDRSDLTGAEGLGLSDKDSEFFVNRLPLILEDKEQLEDLRSEYLRLFDSGRHSTPLYETEYGRERSMFKANELSDLAGFYRAFGFEFEGTEMIDHISVELEFYALLLLKESKLLERGDQTGAEIVQDAKKKFMVSHLGKFVPSILERPGISQNEFYGPILRLTAKIIEKECNQLQIVPERTFWLQSEEENGELACGGTVGCLK